MTRTLALALVSLLAAFACQDDGGLGLPCVMERPATGMQSAIETPSLDCESRVCLQVAAAQPAMCTVACSHEGDACTAAAGALCETAFHCAAPFQVGPFAGRLLCVCDPVVAP